MDRGLEETANRCIKGGGYKVTLVSVRMRWREAVYFRLFGGRAHLKTQKWEMPLFPFRKLVNWLSTAHAAHGLQ